MLEGSGWVPAQNPQTSTPRSSGESPSACRASARRSPNSEPQEDVACDHQEAVGMRDDDQRAEHGERQLRSPAARRAHQDGEREQREAQRELEVHEPPEEGAVVDQGQREQRQPLGLAERAQQGEDADRQRSQREHDDDAHAELRARRPARTPSTPGTAARRSSDPRRPRRRRRTRTAGRRCSKGWRPPPGAAAGRSSAGRRASPRARAAARGARPRAAALAVRAPRLRASRPLAFSPVSKPRVLTPARRLWVAARPRAATRRPRLEIWTGPRPTGMIF